MKYLLSILCLFILSCDNDNDLIDCNDGYSSIIGYSDYWGNSCYYNEDIQVLEDFIFNSSATINYDIDLNNNGIIEWYELGHQKWENSRLVLFSSFFQHDINSNIYYDSRLSGPIPESIINWEYIKDLRLGLGRFDGMLTGDIDIITNLLNLEILLLQNNNFNPGEIPEGIYDLTNLKTLYLAMNSFTGEISSNISNLVNLEWFWIGKNDMYGELPSELWDLPNLYEITVEDNGFTGAIPEFQTGQLNNLYYLNLQNNKFDSVIPNSICLLENLIDSLGMIDENYSEFLGEDWYYFNIENNYFCPDTETLEYPDCIADYIGFQNIEECEGDMIHNNFYFQKNNPVKKGIKILNRPTK